jgi:hypothetical protein
MMITRSSGILRLPRCAGCVAGVAAPRVGAARGVGSCASPAGDASVRRVRTSDPKLNARLPRFTRAVAWLLAAVFGFVFPAHLGGSDHHVTHGHTHHTATAGAAAVPVIEACDPCAHQGEHDHHRGHDHQLLLPSKGGSHASKTVATATPSTQDMVAQTGLRTWFRVEAELLRGRIDRAAPLPRGPPAPTTLVV